MHKRNRILSAMKSMNAPANRLDRFENCGGGSWIVRSTSTDELAVRASHCGDRFCEPCARARAFNLRCKIQRLIDGRECRFITLTLRHRHMPLRDQLDRLGECFTRLRERSIWTSSVTGAVAMIEVKRSINGEYWHPHLHIIALGRFIAKADLVSAWLAVTGDSMVVDIQLVRQNQAVETYITKYITKGIDDRTLGDESWLQEAIAALRGKRLMATYGTLRKSEHDPEEDDREEWQPIRGYMAVIRDAAKGCEESLNLLAELNRSLQKRKEQREHRAPRNTG
jgi:hypothetical protein